jgi:hypothetical protein
MQYIFFTLWWPSSLFLTSQERGAREIMNKRQTMKLKTLLLGYSPRIFLWMTEPPSPRVVITFVPSLYWVHEAGENFLIWSGMNATCVR